MRQTLLISVFLLSLLLVAPPATALQRPMTLKQLVNGAEHIVVARAKKVTYTTAHWPRVGTLPFTDVTLLLEEQWKGHIEGTELVVRVPGGKRPGGSWVRASDTPSFQEGEKVLVFTYTNFGKQWVYGWQQGKYRMFVKRVVGKVGYPVPRDILTFPLKRKIEALLRTATKRGG